ncbi:MAG: hypothetical protein P8X74_09325 [Reinekea sp.]
MLPDNWGEPMGAPATFERQIEIKLLHLASTLKSRIQVFSFRHACLNKAFACGEHNSWSDCLCKLVLGVTVCANLLLP